MLIFITALILYSLFLIYFQKKFSFLIDNPIKQKHKSNLNKNIPLSGGIFFFIVISACSLISNYSLTNIITIIFLLLFLVLGVYSDLKVNFKPKIRLFYQAILLSFLITLLKLNIDKTNIFFLDYYIDNIVFNFLFTFACIIVFLNGSNFCDGINVNLIGYYLIIILAIYSSGLPLPIIFFKIEYIIVMFLIFYIFNLFGKYFLGDNGVYVVSIFISIYIIKFINLNNDQVSSLLALNLLWYPAFENLFSIIRRKLTNEKVQIADRKHLHILIHKKISKRINYKISNSLSGIFLNLYMSIGIFISIFFYAQSDVLLLITLINIILYLITYFYLLKKN